MDWARSETKGGQLAATNMNWAVTMGDPVANSGQAPAAGRSGLFSGLLGEVAWTLGHHPRLGSHQGQVGHRGCQE